MLTKRTEVAVLGLLLVCAQIDEVTARGRYSNFGPWDRPHVDISGASQPTPGCDGATGSRFRTSTSVGGKQFESAKCGR
jgi:hypothetical protein